ncbi:RNA-guided endonuclease InsQ/TnpB family protein [Streptacidiphilus sp. EB103A]|uniref:RNA-guided endonuclease InsQ/TnpB family protein n=1 Tax=Streptacidiphilus sp. EB103A TaxID=3156275 RepID=UPI00351667E0
MAQQVKRAYRYRFHPTDEQAAELSRTFGCVRLVYNMALEARGEAWRTEQRNIGYVESSVMLTQWKRTKELGFLAEVSSVPLQQGLRHLQKAFGNFFSKRAKYPTFKSKRKSHASAEYTASAFRFRQGQLTLAKMDEPLAIVWSRPLPPGVEPTTVTVSKDAAGRWHVSLLCVDTVEAFPQSDSVVGIDAGITSLLTLSTGEKIANPKFERRDRERLAKAQRQLAKKQKGSQNRAKARLKVAKIHARIADRRRDYLHKLTTRLVRENQAIVIEDLTVRNMVQNHTLARAISDASWTQLRAMLEYKAHWYGRELVVVDRWYPSSKLCSHCGHRTAKLPLNIREWTCGTCGSTHDRDVNAAINIRQEGRRIVAAGRADTRNACGADVGPQRRKPGGQSATKQETPRATAGLPAL